VRSATGLGLRIGLQARNRAKRAPDQGPAGLRETSDLQAIPPMARGGLEPPTPRFSARRRRGCEALETALESGKSRGRERHCPRGYGRICGGLGLRAGLESQCGRLDGVRVEQAALAGVLVGRQGRWVMWRTVQATNSRSLISRLARRSTISAASSSGGRCQWRPLRAMNSRMQM
jgi:hypothetical protein